jgi:hypothetical protein
MRQYSFIVFKKIKTTAIIDLLSYYYTLLSHPLPPNSVLSEHTSEFRGRRLNSPPLSFLSFSSKKKSAPRRLHDNVGPEGIVTRPSISFQLQNKAKNIKNKCQGHQDGGAGRRKTIGRRHPFFDVGGGDRRKV